MNNDIDSLISDLVNVAIEKINKEWKPGEDWVLYSGSFFDNKEYEAAIKCMLSGWLGLGELGVRFERSISNTLWKRHGVFVNSGSSANLLMLSALKSKRFGNMPNGTKVITPAAGFPTTVNPIWQNGFEPVFVDIELKTLNIDIDQLEDAAKTELNVLYLRMYWEILQIWMQ